MWAFNRPFTSNPFFNDYSGVNARDWGWTGITPSPLVMTTPVPDYSSWYNWLSLALLVITVIVFILFKRVSTKEDLLLGVTGMLGIFFAFFYGWSPQFVFWLIPFLMVSFPLAVSIGLRLVVLLEYPFFYALYLARISPDLVTAAPGLTISMTSALAPFGVPAYWSIIIFRTVFILTLGLIAWKKLPTLFWILNLRSFSRPAVIRGILEKLQG